MEYVNSLKLRDALQLYFSKYHFENGGYDWKYFKLKIGPFYFPIPNTKGRVEAVKLHDIHHIITEYKATLQGEAEISGWEIASGCNKYYTARFLNSCSFFYGMFFFPLKMYKAFLKGRNVYTNFYQNFEYNEDLLSKTVGELRLMTSDPKALKNNWLDTVYFFLYCLLLLSIAVFSFYFLYSILLRFCN
jgi:hypothetical protein